jgi:hypothetical protein
MRELLTNQQQTVHVCSGSASSAVCIQYPSTGEYAVTFRIRARPSVLEMVLLHMPDETLFVEHLSTATPQAFKPWSIIGSMNSFQMCWKILAKDQSIARQSIEGPAATVLLQPKTNSDQLA